MGKIIKLDDELANKIAAGEVVERPASVVKELIENAIDANSSVIEIEIEEAGLSKIRILDNGDGIEKEDVIQAFHRHATSKIKDENDLFRIRTLGFRGEALPSIASVSELELKTSTGENIGTHLSLRGGKIVAHQSTSSRKGTDITVSNLFFNTPARLKYMKSIHTELGNISDVVNRMALSKPTVSFRLVHNGKKLLSTNGSGDVQQVIAAIYGVGIAKKMVPITLNSLDFHVSGFLSLPEVTRASRNYISIIINGRYIKNYTLANAIQQGYHTLLPIGRYPIVYLSIDMDPLLVDVNVHPAKHEVRLSKEAELNELITTGIKNCFKERQLIPTGQTSTWKEPNKSEQQQFSFQHTLTQKSEAEGLLKINDSKEEQVLPSPFALLPKSDLIDNDIEFAQFEDKMESQPYFVEEEKTFAKEPLATTNVQIQKERIPPLYPIGQMHGTYILAQNEKGLYIIDQHAAQERIKYEYFREKVGEVAANVQELLVPMTFEYSTNECLLIDAALNTLAAVGVFLEPFGHNSYIVKAHPEWFPKGEEQEIIEEMIEQIFLHKNIDVKKLREEAAILMSCKASIKANRHLRNDEIFALLETLRKSSDPFTCPHGRPIIIHYSTYDMEKMFKRIM